MSYNGGRTKFWKNTHGNDSFCLGYFREDFTKNLLCELRLEGSIDYNEVEIKKGCFNQRE